MIKLSISGCCGKMGSKITNLALLDKRFQVVCLLEEKSHNQIGMKKNGVVISGNPDNIKDSDVLIEFTNPSATIEHLAIALKYKKSIVIGTTALDDDEMAKVKETSKIISIVFSPNMAIGVNLLFRLVKETAGKLSRDYNINIIETHHIHKKDAPSGTAKKLAQIIRQAMGREVLDIRSIREGDVIGEHTVKFDSSLDTIELKHSAKQRGIFAKGALEAAKFVVKKNSGLFDMQDVIDEIAKKV